MYVHGPGYIELESYRIVPILTSNLNRYHSGFHLLGGLERSPIFCSISYVFYIQDHYTHSCVGNTIMTLIQLLLKTSCNNNDAYTEEAGHGHMIIYMYMYRYTHVIPHVKYYIQPLGKSVLICCVWCVFSPALPSTFLPKH